MNHHPDDRQPDNGNGLDEDAAWREIVAHYGEQPDARLVEPVETNEPVETDESAAPDPAPRRDLFDRSYLDSQEVNTPATWDDEGHFVPPAPPPVPRPTPRRLAAWAGLFGAPALMLIVIVLGWNFPTWMMGMLVAWFVGGFLYLVGTMPRGRGDGWSGDDGAVV
jgi:hypothetical protein